MELNLQNILLATVGVNPNFLLNEENAEGQQSHAQDTAQTLLFGFVGSELVNAFQSHENADYEQISEPSLYAQETNNEFNLLDVLLSFIGINPRFKQIN